MKKLITKMISSVLSLVFIFSSVAYTIPVYASENKDEQYYPITEEIAYTFAEMNEVASKSTDITDIETRNLYIDLAKNEINKHEFGVNGGKNNLNFEEVNVVSTNLDSSNFVSVNVAVAGNYSTLSNLNVMFNENNEVIMYTETLIYNNPETNKFIIDNFLNGELFEHKQTDIDFLSNEQIKEGLQGLKELTCPTTRGIGETAGCIAGLLGVNGVVAYLIAGTCTTACAAAPVTGAVCAACIGGICVIGAADIGAIIGCFSLL